MKYDIQRQGTVFNMTRREFLGFFLLGGFLSFFAKKLSGKKISLNKKQKEKEAMFWRREDEV